MFTRIATVFLLHFFTLAGFCQIRNSIFLSPGDSLVVKGKIINFQPEANSFIRFKTYDFLGDDYMKVTKVNPDGTFTAKIFQPYLGEIELSYKSYTAKVYMGRQKQVSVEIDQALINDINTRNPLRVEGSLALQNLLQGKFDSLHRASFSSNKIPRGSNFAVQRLDQLKLELEALYKFSGMYKTYDSALYAWQKSRLQYNAGFDIMVNKSANMDINTSHEDIMEMLGPIKIQSTEALTSSEYYIFLRLYSVCENVVASVNPKNQALKKSNGINGVPIALDKFDEVSDGIVREALYLNVYPDHRLQLNNAEKMWPRFNYTIKNSYLREKLYDKRQQLEGKFERFNILTKIDSVNMPVSSKAKLRNLFEGYKGTNVHIDFWGDWCAPCMMEMPSYPRLIKELKNENIRFVFLSAFTKDANVVAVKKKFGINGDFVNLADDEVPIIKMLFDFQGYPAHFIIDKEGNVVNSKILNLPTTERASFIKNNIILN